MVRLTAIALIVLATAGDCQAQGLFGWLFGFRRRSRVCVVARPVDVEPQATRVYAKPIEWKRVRFRPVIAITPAGVDCGPTG